HICQSSTDPKTNHILKQIISKSDFFKIKFQKKETGKIRHKTLTYSKPSVLQRKYPKKTICLPSVSNRYTAGTRYFSDGAAVVRTDKNVTAAERIA
ncbi:TPA: hypothetical protein WNH60_001630, partial [Neisseria gonorrhoeae]